MKGQPSIAIVVLAWIFLISGMSDLLSLLLVLQNFSGGKFGEISDLVMHSFRHSDNRLYGLPQETYLLTKSNSNWCVTVKVTVDTRRHDRSD